MGEYYAYEPPTRRVRKVIAVALGVAFAVTGVFGVKGVMDLRSEYKAERRNLDLPADPWFRTGKIAGVGNTNMELQVAIDSVLVVIAGVFITINELEIDKLYEKVPFLEAFRSQSRRSAMFLFLGLMALSLAGTLGLITGTLMMAMSVKMWLDLFCGEDVDDYDIGASEAQYEPKPFTQRARNRLSSKHMSQRLRNDFYATSQKKKKKPQQPPTSTRSNNSKINGTMGSKINGTLGSKGSRSAGNRSQRGGRSGGAPPTPPRRQGPPSRT